MKKIKKLEEPVIWIQKDKKTVSPAKEMSIKEFSINLQKFIDNHAKGDNIEEYKITTKDVIKYIRPLSFCPNSDEMTEPYYINCKRLIELTNTL